MILGGNGGWWWGGIHSRLSTSTCNFKSLFAVIYAYFSMSPQTCAGLAVGIKDTRSGFVKTPFGEPVVA